MRHCAAKCLVTFSSLLVALKHATAHTRLVSHLSVSSAKLLLSPRRAAGASLLLSVLTLMCKQATESTAASAFAGSACHVVHALQKCVGQGHSLATRYATAYFALDFLVKALKRATTAENAAMLCRALGGSAELWKLLVGPQFSLAVRQKTCKALVSALGLARSHKLGRVLDAVVVVLLESLEPCLRAALLVSSGSVLGCPATLRANCDYLTSSLPSAGVPSCGVLERRAVLLAVGAACRLTVPSGAPPCSRFETRLAALGRRLVSVVEESSSAASTGKCSTCGRSTRRLNAVAVMRRRVCSALAAHDTSFIAAANQLLRVGARVDLQSVISSIDSACRVDRPASFTHALRVATAPPLVLFDVLRAICFDVAVLLDMVANGTPCAAWCCAYSSNSCALCIVQTGRVRRRSTLSPRCTGWLTIGQPH